MVQLAGSSDINIINIVNSVCSTEQLAARRQGAMQLIESTYSELLQALTFAAHKTVPALAPHTLKHWWCAGLQKLKGAANGALVKWREGGSPRQGALFENLKSSKKNFKLEIKKQKKISREGVNAALLSSLASSANFWKLWRSKLGDKKALLRE